MRNGREQPYTIGAAAQILEEHDEGTHAFGTFAMAKALNGQRVEKLQIQFYESFLHNLSF
jgi:hypothetical protein